MIAINRLWRTLSFRDKKLNAFIMLSIFIVSSFIGAFIYILPGLIGSVNNKDQSIESRFTSNAGYEESITVNIDKYGNLTVLGSFQGPQVDPGVNWSLPEYDYVWILHLTVVNPNRTDYIHQTQAHFVDPNLSPQDVYLYFSFLLDPQSSLSMGMEKCYILDDAEMVQTAATLKADLENAFGIQNNFSSTALSSYETPGMFNTITYGFNYSAAVDYNYFLQFYADHTPAGLAKSVSVNRINDTYSWISWSVANNPLYGEMATSTLRSPYANYNNSFELNVFLQYPQFFGPSYPSSDYSFHLSDILDAPFDPVSPINVSSFSISEVNVVVENGNITSPASPPYHIPQYLGIDHDWWVLRNASFYDTFDFGTGSLADILVNFSTPVVEMPIFLPPTPPLSVSGNVSLYVKVNTTLTSNFGSMLFAEIYDVPHFMIEIFDDFAYMNSFPRIPIATIQLFDSGMTGDYIGLWEDTYRYPNGDYYLFVYAGYSNLSSLTPRSKYMGSGGIIYNYSRLTLNNPKQIQLDVLSPTPNEAVIKNLYIDVNVTSPEPLLSVEYAIYNYSQYNFWYSWGMLPMVNGYLTNRTQTLYNTTWNSLEVPSTEDYVLRITVTDANDTFFQDIPITVNNTFYQESIPIYAPLGAHSGYGYDLLFGMVEAPIYTDPFDGGGGSPPMPLMFYGYGVDFGLDLDSVLYQQMDSLFIIADKPGSENLLYQYVLESFTPPDFGFSIMMLDTSPDNLQIGAQVATEIKTAFNLPNSPELISIAELEVGDGDMRYFYTYGLNYSGFSYNDIIDKFHASVPSGLADVFTKENMTQAGVDSSIFFSWYNPTGLFSQMFGSSPYNVGYGAGISPIITYPNYFNSTLKQNWTISTKQLFPQLPQINACAPTVASHVLSGFGVNQFMMPTVITLNSNITAWYPMNMNVIPITDMVVPGSLNALQFVMLDTTTTTPYGLLTTDDIRFNFTGPYITCNLLTPNEGQSVELDLYNVTILSSYSIGDGNTTDYAYIHLETDEMQSPIPLYWNGMNYTNILNTINQNSGQYKLLTHAKDDAGYWAINETTIYFNNTAQDSTLDILINEWGDVEISANKPYYAMPTLGYGVKLGIDPIVFNETDLYGVLIGIVKNDTINGFSNYIAQENWNFFVQITGTSTSTIERLNAIVGPTIDEIEHAFGIEGLLIQVNGKRDFTTDSPSLYWGMNFTPSRPYEYFIDHYHSSVNGNLSKIFSKQNMLMADESSIYYHIYPLYLDFGPFFGYPENLDYGENVLAIPIMKFNHVYNYTTLNQTYQFSLASFLGIDELNTNFEQQLTITETYAFSQVSCGNLLEWYPNNPLYSMYMGTMGGMTPDTVRHTLLIGNRTSRQGYQQIDDIRFNFSAPRAIIDILSPLPGSIIHGNVDVIANATMLYPTTQMANVSIFPAGQDIQTGIMPLPIQEFDIYYNPTEGYWNGTWQTLNTSLYNGWYDVIFTFTDALGQTQRNISRIYIDNLQYSETLSLSVDQFGNVSTMIQLAGGKIKDEFNYSIPEYDHFEMIALIANNPYLNNWTKDILFGGSYPWPSNDIFLVLFGDLTPSELLQFSPPIVADYEHVFGIEGNLSYLTIQKYISSAPGMGLLNGIIYGCNFSPNVNYEQFIDYFHFITPDGVNNTVPTSTITGAESFFELLQFPSGMSMMGSTPPNIDKSYLFIILGTTFPQYFGSNYMTNTLQSHTLSLKTLFNVPQITFAPAGTASSQMAQVSINIENGNITNYYPMGILNQNSPRALFGNPVTHNVYTGSDYMYMTINMSVLDDINVTFNEPMTRPIMLSPLPGASVDGLTEISVLVENRTPVDRVTLKIYLEEEYDQLTINSIMGGSMPYNRPAGLYREADMVQVAPGIWNLTWPAYQHPDGPIRIEVVVHSQNTWYSYNTTEVIVSNSQPMAINLLSPTDGAAVSDMIEISAQVINSTPIQSVMCEIMDEYRTYLLDTFPLEPQGGGLYSTYWGTHGLRNGTYSIRLRAYDTYGFAINYSKITISNPKLFNINLLYPINKLESAPTANITANATGPYPAKFLTYKITQNVINPYYGGQYTNVGTMAEGFITDPNSVWVAEFDSSSWPSQVQYDFGWGPQLYDAYYQILINGTDLRNARYFFASDYIEIGIPAVPAAEIIAPNESESVSDIFYVWVNVTDGMDSFNQVMGDVRRSSNNEYYQDLTFTIMGGLASAPVYSYATDNDTYRINVWGDTMQSGSFSDSVEVIFQNTEQLTATLSTPSGSVSGLVLSEATLTYPYPLQEARLEILRQSDNNYMRGCQFYHNPLLNVSTWNITSYNKGGWGYLPSTVQVHSLPYQYATAFIRDGDLYFGNSTDGINWDYSLIFSGSYDHPSLVQGIDGTFYIVVEDDGSNSMNIINSTNGGVSWTAAVTIASVRDSQPHMIQLQNGSFMIAYVQNDNELKIMVNGSPSLLSNWHSKSLYTDSSGLIMAPSLVQITDGSFKIALSYRPNGENIALIYLINLSMDTSTSSTPYLIVPYRDWGDWEGDQNPSIVQSQDGTLYVIFNSEESMPFGQRQLAIINSANHINWTRPSPVTWNTSEARSPWLIQRLDGTMMLTYETNRLGGWEIFVKTFENITVCNNWIGFIPTYTLQNDFYNLELRVQDINQMEVRSNMLTIDTNNSQIFTINMISPTPGATVSGLMTIKLDVQGPYPTSWTWVNIEQDMGDWWNHMDDIYDMQYNSTSGYWESQYPTWKLSDGQYIIMSGAKDIYNTEIYTQNTVTFSNPVKIGYNLLSPNLTQPLYGNITYLIDAYGPEVIKWVRWDFNYTEQRYPIYQGLTNSTTPWLSFNSTNSLNSLSVIQLQNGSLLATFEAGGWIYTTLNTMTGWTMPQALVTGNKPCLYQMSNGTIILAYEHWISDWAIECIYSYDGGSHWTSSFIVANSPSDEHNPTLAEMANGTVVIAFDTEVSGNTNIELMKLRTNGSWTWRHTVISRTGWDQDPAIIRTFDNNFVIAYQTQNQYGNRIIVTEYSTDNCSSFDTPSIVTHDSYHYWSWWEAPSIIQTPTEGYVVACMTSNSPWSMGGDMIFIFNSSDRINWGIAKPIRNDTTYSIKYNDRFPSLLQLQNGTILVGFINWLDSNGFYFTTFESMTENGYWMLTLDTHQYPNGWADFSLTIEDVWHVEPSFPPETHEFRNPGLWGINTNYTRVLIPNETLHIWFYGEANMLNPQVWLGPIPISCTETLPGYYEGWYTVTPSDNYTGLQATAWLMDTGPWSNWNSITSSQLINIRNASTFITGNYVVDGSTISLIGEWYFINGSLIVQNGGQLDIIESLIELRGNPAYPHQINNSNLLILSSDILLAPPAYNPMIEVASNLNISYSKFELDIINFGIVDAYGSQLGAVQNYDSAIYIADTVVQSDLEGYGNAILDIFNSQTGNITLSGNITARFEQIGIPGFSSGIIIGNITDWPSETSQIWIENCSISQIWNYGVDTNVTIINDVWYVGWIGYSVGVNGTVTMRDAQPTGYEPIILGTYGQDFRYGTTIVNSNNTIIVVALVYAYDGADLTIYNVTIGGVRVTDSNVVINRSSLNDGSPLTTFQVAEAYNSNVTVIGTYAYTNALLGDGTYGWGINNTSPGFPNLEGNVMYIDFGSGETYPIDGPQQIYLIASINGENATWVEWTVNGTPQTTQWVDINGFNSSSFWWQVAYDGWYVIGARANNSAGQSLYHEILVYVQIQDTIIPSVELLVPLNGTVYQEYDPISIVVNASDNVLVESVEIYSNDTHILDLTFNGVNWTGIWTDTIGWWGINNLQIKAYDTVNNVNDTVWAWINITKYTPPADHADVYELTLTNSTGGEDAVFDRGETVNYTATIRGDAASTTYVVTAQTDDPLLQGYLQINESVTVQAGEDLKVYFSFNIPSGAEVPTGIYTVQIIVMTDWPWNGGYCVDFIETTFEVV
ncbi:MAG: Ig-like domain-containing protein [Candidatus Helarchaeota archaeon]